MSMSQLQMKGKHEAYWITISSDEYESMKSTIETLSDPEVMKQLMESQADIKTGRTKNWDDFVKQLKKA